MVTAPKCKVCGVAHFGSDHVWPGVRGPTAPKPAPAPRPAPVQRPVEDGWDKTIAALRAELVGARAEIADLKAKLAATQPKPAFDRAAYMRAYRARNKGES